jgi:adenosylmethionine-8-amino-7-oxononanoate aminotransferase
VRRGFLHSHSYTGNPLACRAALATLAIFAEDDVLAQNRRKAQMFADAFAPLRDDPRVRHVRQQGMIFAFDAIVDDAEKAATFSRRFFSAALQQELLMRPIGRSVYLMPPYILSDDEIALLAQKTMKVFEEVMA